ncbi:hypothetical protein MMUR_00630 [Mycolicibacterium murale]|uniref:Transposase n=2 Tax=Mycolicibacterium murale TaxID=182220 RepID=A0A7I9WF79_9MYCO|nr:hypothetical protein MMUR_00630 [Mycolicibacterium murale]
MRRAFVSDAQCDIIGEALDDLSWRRSIGVVDRQPGADRLDKIRACERRSVSPCDTARRTTPRSPHRKRDAPLARVMLAV